MRKLLVDPIPILLVVVNQQETGWTRIFNKSIIIHLLSIKMEIRKHVEKSLKSKCLTQTNKNKSYYRGLILGRGFDPEPSS